MRTMKSTWKRVATLTLGLLVVAVPSATAGGPVTVLATNAFELNPVASVDYLAWDVATNDSWNAYEKPFGGSPVRVNARGTKGSVGAINGTKLIYQQWTGRESGIYLFDLKTHRRIKPPAPVNTDRWEYGPGLSGHWLIFAGSFRSEDRKLYLYNRMMGSIQSIASTSGKHVSLSPGQVNGGYVVYDITRWNSQDTEVLACNVYRYGIESGKTVRIPNEGPRCQYSPSVSATGTVYYARSGLGCGANARLVRYPIGGPVETVVTFANGHDLAWGTYAVDNGDSTTDVYYDYASCTRAISDIKKITAAT